jgi:hypothetical protein
MSANILDKRIRSTLVQGQDNIPRYMTELTDFINLVKHRDIYIMDLETSEQAIIHAFYPKVLESTEPGIQYLETKRMAPLSFIKILILALSNEYTNADLMKYIEQWIVPYYVKNHVVSKAEIDTVSLNILNFALTIKDFILRREFMVHVLSDATVIDSRLLQASFEAGSVAFLMQFIAWHLYNNYDRMRAMVLMASLELHIARTITKNTHIAERLDKFLRFLDNIYSHKMLNGKPVASNTKPPVPSLADKERLAKDAENALLRENAAEKEAAKAKALKKSKKKTVKNTNTISTSSLSPIPRPLPAASPPVASPAASPPVATPVDTPVATPVVAPVATGVAAPALQTVLYTIPPPPTVAESPMVERFWTTVKHIFMFDILRRIAIATMPMPNVRFYVKGSAALSMYYRMFRHGLPGTNPHTSDYDCTLLVNPELPKADFYAVRSQALDILITQCLRLVNGSSLNPYLTEVVQQLGIPFAMARYNPREGIVEYTEFPAPPATLIDIDEKRLPTFYTNSANTYEYGRHKETPSPMLLNMRILRTMKEPKNITLVSLYLKTNPEIKLLDIAVPFYVYPGPPVYMADAQIALEEQWANAQNNSLIQDIPVLSLESLYKEQQRLLNLPSKTRSLIEARMAYIKDVLVPIYVEKERMYAAAH